jgi:hypothetical protein
MSIDRYALVTARETTIRIDARDVEILVYECFDEVRQAFRTKL